MLRRTLPCGKDLLQQDTRLCEHGCGEPVGSSLSLCPRSVVLQLVCPHEALYQHLQGALVLAI